VKKKFKSTYVYLLLVLVLGLFVFYSTANDAGKSVTKLSLFDVMQKIEKGQIKSIEQVVSSSDDGEFVVVDKDGNQSVVYASQEAFSDYLYNLSPELRNSFKFTSREPQGNLFFPIVQIILIIGMFIFIMVFQELSVVYQVLLEFHLFHLLSSLQLLQTAIQSNHLMLISVF